MDGVLVPVNDPLAEGSITVLRDGKFASSPFLDLVPLVFVKLTLSVATLIVAVKTANRFSVLLCLPLSVSKPLLCALTEDFDLFGLEVTFLRLFFACIQPILDLFLTIVSPLLQLFQFCIQFGFLEPFRWEEKLSGTITSVI